MPVGTEYFATDRVLDTGGIELDQTDYQNHNVGYDWGLDHTRVVDFDDPGGADWDNRKKVYRAHAKDQGASRAQNFGQPLTQFADEHYHFFRWPGYDASQADNIPALAGGGGRGLNAASTNNPPLEMYDGQGFRPGVTETEYPERKLAVRIMQRQDARPWTPNLAYVETAAPPARKEGAPLNPFGNLARVITSVSKRALTRRSPELPGDVEAEQADQFQEGPSPTIGYGFGGE